MMGQTIQIISLLVETFSAWIFQQNSDLLLAMLLQLKIFMHFYFTVNTLSLPSCPLRYFIFIEFIKLPTTHGREISVMHNKEVKTTDKSHRYKYIYKSYEQ